MKKIVLLTLLLFSFRAFSQVECKFKVKILQDSPGLSDVIGWEHDDEMVVSQWPDAKAKEIADTFEITHYCIDNGVSVVQAIRPHEKRDELGFRDGYQIVFWNENAPAELKEIATGDCFFIKIIPFFKANRMPSGLDRPIKLNEVWISVPQYASSNIYYVAPLGIYKLTPIDCNCDKKLLPLNDSEGHVKENEPTVP